MSKIALEALGGESGKYLRHAKDEVWLQCLFYTAHPIVIILQSVTALIPCLVPAGIIT